MFWQVLFLTVLLAPSQSRIPLRPLAWQSVVFDEVVFVVAVAKAADAVVFVADKLIVLDGDARDPSTEIKSVAQIAAADVVGKQAVGLAATSVIAGAAAILDEAIGDVIAAPFLHADAVGRPAVDVDVFEAAIGHFEQVDGGKGESEVGRRAFLAQG